MNTSEMNNLSELEMEFSELSSRAESGPTMYSVIDKCHKACSLTHDISNAWDKLDKEFEAQTRLTKTDWSFLLFATALQCFRQYFLTDFKERLNDKEAAIQTKGHTEEHSNRKPGWYKASREEILYNPVPFDAMYCGSKPHIGLSGGNHRYKTLGHDPILGYVVGTANILTSTLTLSNLQSYHIKTGQTANGGLRDQINCKAQNSRIYESVKHRIFDEGWDGRFDFAAALLKEHRHLCSDTQTKCSLPIPFLSLIDDKLAKNMASYGFDIANVRTITEQVELSILINYIIAGLHFLCKPKDVKNNFYECRTRKILTYSNLLATSSNIIYTTIIGPYIGDANAMRKIDIGGMGVTFLQAISNTKLQYKVKGEFIKSNLHNMIQNDYEY